MFYFDEIMKNAFTKSKLRTTLYATLKKLEKHEEKFTAQVSHNSTRYRSEYQD